MKSSGGSPGSFSKDKGQRLIFSIRNIQCTPDGHLLDFDVRTLFIRPKGENIEDRNHPLVKAFKETLKSIYPWSTIHQREIYHGTSKLRIRYLGEK